MQNADVWQPFRKETLTKDDDFFKDAKEGPYVVEGSGQRVYWKQCTIIEYGTDEITVMGRHSMCDGEATVDRGTKLYFGEGKVKEE